MRISGKMDRIYTENHRQSVKNFLCRSHCSARADVVETGDWIVKSHVVKAVLDVS